MSRRRRPQRRRAAARARRRTGALEATIAGTGALWLPLGGRPWTVALVVGALVVLDVAVSLALRRRRRRRLRTLQGFLGLSPAGFEVAVAELLRRLGFASVRLVGGAGDLCADITCRDAGGRRTVVQCKRWAPGRRVGSPDVQAAIGMATVHHGAERLVYATTAGYTAAARALAGGHDVWLIDGEQLVELWRRHMLGRPGNGA